MCGFVCPKRLTNITCAVRKHIYLFQNIFFGPKERSAYTMSSLLFSLFSKKGHVLLLSKIGTTKDRWLCLLKDDCYHHTPSKCKCTSFKTSSLCQKVRAKGRCLLFPLLLKKGTCFSFLKKTVASDIMALSAKRDPWIPKICRQKAYIPLSIPPGVLCIKISILPPHGFCSLPSRK
jgi:hypothetical protein